MRPSPERRDVKATLRPSGEKAGWFSPRVEGWKGARCALEAPVSETRKSCSRDSGVLKTSLVPRMEIRSCTLPPEGSGSPRPGSRNGRERDPLREIRQSPTTSSRPPATHEIRLAPATRSFTTALAGAAGVASLVRG